VKIQFANASEYLLIPIPIPAPLWSFVLPDGAAEMPDSDPDAEMHNNWAIDGWTVFQPAYILVFGRS